MRKWIALIAGLLMLALANHAIYRKEQLLSQGRVVLLELAPVDPRSLMQGDYMALRYKVADEVFGRGRLKQGLHDGRIVLQLDAQGVGRFLRFDDAAALGVDEVRMRYRIRGEQVKFASNAFFFQEGQARLYQGARYGEFRVDAQGEALLTGLRGPDGLVLGLALQ
ncbi:MAG: GDYXXLXY domain-containing protein [Gammaproteobacteria bacterium]|nr:GDYXXLXY domain-containing protein [Gammaproteobacteria bacterium]